MNKSMQVTVKLFSHFRRIAGTERLAVELFEGATAADLIDVLSGKLDGAGLTDRSASLMINHRHAVPEAALNDGDEVLLLPIIGGG